MPRAVGSVCLYGDMTARAAKKLKILRTNCGVLRPYNCSIAIYRQLLRDSSRATAQGRLNIAVVRV